MICLDSALAHWDLSDELPSEVHLAVPEGSHRPTIDYPPTRVHVFRAPTFSLGRVEVRDERGDRFWISDRERTIVDAFRLRHLMGEDAANAALRRYLADRPKPGRVAELACALRVWTPLASAMRLLQA
jgi:predicted transcriptional regulator of viral defense system